MSLITTVIFDMYGTLVYNDAEMWKATFEKIIQAQGLDTDTESLWEEWRSVDHEYRAERVKPDTPFHSYYEAWREAFVRAFAALNLSGDAEAAVTKSISDLSRRDPYPETVQTLRTIERGWRIALLSNADDIFLLPNLKLLNLDFEAVLSSEEARDYKPQPSLFLEMLRRLGVTPQETVYVGDRQLEDILGASQVGISAVWINRSGDSPDPELPKPAYQISSLAKLPALLTAWPLAEDGTL
jgi:2-haloalkanoic acid dehalogenase type II